MGKCPRNLTARRGRPTLGSDLVKPRYWGAKPAGGSLGQGLSSEVASADDP